MPDGGYDVSPLCPRCNFSCVDDAVHRILSCKHGEALRAKLGVEGMEQARSVLGLRGWAQPPQLGDLWPMKAESSEHFVLTYKIDDTVVEAFRFAANADIFGDGS